MSMMEKHGVVPDVIDAAPANSITVKYDSGAEAKQGNELTPTQVQNQPITFEYPADPNTFYTVIMIDSDAPSRADPSSGEILHWLVSNVPGHDVSKGETLGMYFGSGPSEGSGLHRYIFLVYKQPGKVTYVTSHDTWNKLDARIKFKSREFAAKYNLGQPIAGNFYQAQYDDFVPVLRAKLASIK